MHLCIMFNQNATDLNSWLFCSVSISVTLLPYLYHHNRAIKPYYLHRADTRVPASTEKPTCTYQASATSLTFCTFQVLRVNLSGKKYFILQNAPTLLLQVLHTHTCTWNAGTVHIFAALANRVKETHDPTEITHSSRFVCINIYWLKIKYLPSSS